MQCVQQSAFDVVPCKSFTTVDVRCNWSFGNHRNKCCLSFLYHVRVEIIFLNRDLSRISAWCQRANANINSPSWINVSKSALQIYTLLAINFDEKQLFRQNVYLGRYFVGFHGQFRFT